MGGMTAISSLRNLGPAIETELNRAGVQSAEELREIGVDAAYTKLLEAGTRPHFIGYYVLHMALQGRPWNDCKGKEKETLRKSFDALVASTKPMVPTGIERTLDQIGTGLRR